MRIPNQSPGVIRYPLAAPTRAGLIPAQVIHRLTIGPRPQPGPTFPGITCGDHCWNMYTLCSFILGPGDEDCAHEYFRCLLYCGGWLA